MTKPGRAQGGEKSARARAEDKPGRAQGGETAEPGRKHDFGIAALRLDPSHGPFGGGAAAVKKDDTRARKAVAELALQLRSEVYLGDEDERLRASAQRFGDEMEIDLGLAAAGDSEQQELGVVAQGGGGG